MKQMINTLNEARKSNSVEFWGGIVYCIALFSVTFMALWGIKILNTL